MKKYFPAYAGLLLILLNGCSPSINKITVNTTPTPTEPKPEVLPTVVPDDIGDKPLTVAPTAVPEPPEPQPAFPVLDEDGNGLYDDTERKVLLDVFLEACPEMYDIVTRQSLPVIKASSNYQEDFNLGGEGDIVGDRHAFKGFDTNHDGKVTVLEQTANRPPLSLLVPKRIVDTEHKIPWAIDIFPEWLSTAFLQEDVAVGEVANHISRGVWIRDAALENRGGHLQKAADKSGIAFRENSGDRLVTTGRMDARWDYRWCLFTFRIDANSGRGNETILLDVNSGNQAGMSTPRIWFDKSTGLNIQYVGKNKEGLDRRVMSTKNIVADGKSWNVLVCGIRYGQMYASVNGVPLSTTKVQPPRYATSWARDRQTYIGGANDNAAWAYDAIVMGLTEPSEAMVRKMTGWAAHRLGFADRLPEGHPYRNERPVLDKEDFPRRYNHDDITWNNWGRGIHSSVTRVNSGGPRVQPGGFERVFCDDFRANRITDSESGEGDLWTGFGFNTAVGIDGPLIRPSQSDKAYVHDPARKIQKLAVVPQGDNRWRSAAIYTINDMGYGYTWTGPKIFRIQCMFPKIPQEKLAPGIFPAFWSYGVESIFWRTSNRIEIDYFEFEGTSGSWLNGLSTHYHYPYVKGDKNIFAKNGNSYNRFKVYAGKLDEPKSKLPYGGIFVWDGEYHTWEFVIEEDMTYVNVSMKDEFGHPQWVEVYRYKTAPTYLEQIDLQINTALKGKGGKGYPKTRESQDYFINWVEVLQKTEQIESISAPFTARPQIGIVGPAIAGNTVHCKPNTEGVSDLRYYWFADGYPLTYGTSSSYTLTKDDEGRRIRCMVKAVGALDQPEAWSKYLNQQ